MHQTAILDRTADEDVRRPHGDQHDAAERDQGREPDQTQKAQVHRMPQETVGTPEGTRIGNPERRLPRAANASAWQPVSGAGRGGSTEPPGGWLQRAFAPTPENATPGGKAGDPVAAVLAQKTGNT